jgi:hypothetical protein
LVLFSHAMNVFEGWATTAPGGVWEAITLIIRSGTPTFFVIFGVAVELVHVQRWQAGNGARVRKALLKRAWQCYLAFGLVAVAAAVGGSLPWGELIPGLLLLHEVPNGTVLSFYAFACLACIVLVPLRNKIGTLGVLAVCLAWWPIEALIEPLFAGDDAYILPRVFGIGEGAGPSMLHGLSLVAAGMVLGQVVKAKLRGPVPKRLTIEVGTLIGIALAAAVVLVAQLGLVETVKGWLNIAALRQTNHWGYFVLGFLVAVSVLLIAYVVVEKWGLTKGRPPGPFGSSSLLAFGGGNIALNLLEPLVTATTAVQAVLMSTAFVVAVRLAIKAGRIVKARRANRV